MTCSELGITGDLSDALGRVLGAVPSAVDAVVVVAACLDRLAKGYGLSESGRLDWGPLEKADLPAPAQALIRQLFAGGAGELTADHLRDGLYEALVRLAEDRVARKTLNANSPLTDLELLHLGQIYWNLEARGARARLPLRPRRISSGSKPGAAPMPADIRVPNADRDFATMTWTARVNEKGSYKSSGQAFRNQGARLAVLAAQLVVTAASQPLPDLEGAVLHHAQADRSPPRVSSITWPEAEPTPTPPVSAPRGHTAAVVEAPQPVPSDRWPVDRHADLSRQRVVVGAPAPVGTDYQRRGFDTEIEQLWADGADRRIWLRGGPGRGKSYTARRVMQQALSDQAPDREVLLVWVDSADPDSVTTAFAEAMDQLGHLGVVARSASKAAEGQRAKALLGLLASSAWRWLIVLDNADARALFDAGLVPTGANPNGRVLATTRSRDPRIASHGRAVRAGLFTAEEAEAYLRGDPHSAGHGHGPLPAASEADTAALAAAVGRHPLALSVAASTIVANAMTVADWIEEFTATEVMDDAADEPDRGGYPHLIGATWQVALARASTGLAEGVVERAAMVAAVQDPDGHPTWLWDRPAVAGWVADGHTLARRHGMPVAVQRLLEHGVLELRGAWRDGRITLHRLAVRAIREAADPGALAELAGILTEQWLLAITANPEAARPEVLHRSLRPITVLPGLPTPTRTMATALLAYQQPGRGSADFARRMAESLQPYLAVGGVTVRLELARYLVDLGDAEAALGRTGRAEAEYREAGDLYRQLVEDPSLTDDERASCLKALGDLDAHLGDPDQAGAHRQQAARLLDRLTDTGADPGAGTGTRGRRLVALITVYDLLGDSAGRARAEARAVALLTHAPADLPNDPTLEDDLEQGYTWQTLGALMQQAGHLDQAKDCLTRAAAAYERSTGGGKFDVRWQKAVLELGLLHARTGLWADAETHLTRITNPQQTPRPDPFEESYVDDEGGWTYVPDSERDALVLLASVQTHLGRREDADQSLARAAEQYRDPTSDDELGTDDWVDSLPDDVREILRQSWEEHRRDTLFFLAAFSLRDSRWEDARGLSSSLLDLAQQGADAAPGDEEAEAELARAHQSMGWALNGLGVSDDAAMHLTRAVDIRQMLTDLDPSRVGAHRQLAHALYLQAFSLDKAGRHQAGADSMTRSVSAFRRVAELAPDDLQAARGLADALGSLAGMQARLGHLDAAVGCHEESISILSTLADRAPHDRTTQIALADVLKDLGKQWIHSGDREAASRQFRRAVDVLAPLAQADDEVRGKLAHTQFCLVAALGPNHPQEALTPAVESVANYRALAERAHDDHEIQKALALSLMLLGEVVAAIGQQVQAVDHLTSAANILQLLAELNPGERPDELIATLNALESLLRDLGRTDEADQAHARATELQHTYPDDEDE